MKGHLDIEQLKSMKREELQALAKDMGVSAGGKNEEIIARIAAVEVDIPEESELTDEDKTAAEQAAKEAAKEAEKQAAEQAEKEAAEQKAKEEADKAAGKVKVEVITKYLDKQFNQIKESGAMFFVDKDRAAQLVAAQVAKIKE